MTDIIFDLDGTLWNASKSTSIAWSKVFKKWKLNIKISKNDIESVAGKPYFECLSILAPEVLVHMQKDLIIKELEKFEKETMKDNGGEYYQYALEAVNELYGDYRLFIVSNCNGWYMEEFLNKSSTREKFLEAVCFSTFSKPKIDNLIYLKNKYSITNGIYIGDTQGDKTASEMAGFLYIHHKEGFNKELKNDYIFSDFSELTKIIKNVPLK